MSDFIVIKTRSLFLINVSLVLTSQTRLISFKIASPNKTHKMSWFLKPFKTLAARVLSGMKH